MPEPETALRLEVMPEEPAVPVTPDLRNSLLSHPVVRAEFANADLWIVRLDAVEKEGDDEPRFHALLADMAGSSVVEADGGLWNPESVAMWSTGRHRLPNDEEHAWALGLVRNDPAVAAGIDAGEIEPYLPLPPLASTVDPSGAIVRAVTVGLREAGGDRAGGPRHRLMAVHSSEGDVAELEAFTGEEDGAADGPGPGSAPNLASHARVKVWRGEELLWELVVVRAPDSSGSNGSGVELRHVDYQGVRVLQRAHVPIVTVDYGGTEAARMWLTEEAGFEAEPAEAEPAGGSAGEATVEAAATGSAGVPEDPVPGYRVCASAPRTIADRGEGGGGFRGVALFLDQEGGELVVLSQLQAGWQRYVSEWRLLADGTIRPRMRFAAVRNPRTGRPHTHHAYWRLDFDIARADDNLVQELNEPNLPGHLAPAHTFRYETSRTREQDRRRSWRVKTVRSPHGYAIEPGPHDGTADPHSYGAGDVWIVAYHADEMDDGEGVSTHPYRSRAQLDRLVSGEVVERADIVMWYAAHATGEGGPAVGPDLVPFNWRARVDRAAYEPLVPPSIKGPDDDDDDDEDEDEDDEDDGSGRDGSGHDDSAGGEPPAPPVDFPIA